MRQTWPLMFSMIIGRWICAGITVILSGSAIGSGRVFNEEGEGRPVIRQACSSIRAGERDAAGPAAICDRDPQRNWLRDHGGGNHTLVMFL
jgi:hypothetical protein